MKLSRTIIYTVLFFAAMSSQLFFTATLSQFLIFASIFLVAFAGHIFYLNPIVYFIMSSGEVSEYDLYFCRRAEHVTNAMMTAGFLTAIAPFLHFAFTSLVFAVAIFAMLAACAEALILSFEAKKVSNVQPV